MEYGLAEPLERKEGVSNSYQTMMAKEQFVKQAVPQNDMRAATKRNGAVDIY